MRAASAKSSFYSEEIGSYCEIAGCNPVEKLEYGMDFRDPIYREEVFLQFYEYHLKYNSHPGAVYYVFDYLFEKYNLDTEQKLWLCFLNGCSQNIVTSWLIFQEVPDIHNFKWKKLQAFWESNYSLFGWDTDRRHHKKCFLQSVRSYLDNLGNKSQEQFYNDLTPHAEPLKNFTLVWDKVYNNFFSFGRLSSFSYIEYIRIAGVNVDCNDLLFGDLTGSKSHRNGICKVFGRDDLDWHKEKQHRFTPAHFQWATEKGEELLKRASERFNHKHLSYFTLESTLCCYKSWFRVNRRYPNVYNDMFYDRIVKAIKTWKTTEPFSVFWDARRHSLPRHLLREANRNDPGLVPVKQNHFRLTGQVIMMDKDYPWFKNDFNDAINS